MKTIVVSAVNIRKGGTLTILRECLTCLSPLAASGRIRAIAIVHKRALCDFPAIEYIEIPSSIDSWAHRLYNEYVRFYRISTQIGPIHLWLSLHDTTPRVRAAHRAVYCQTAFPFYHWRWRDLAMDYKIPLFATLARFVYQINADKNDFLLVQTEWMRRGMSRLLHLPRSRFVVFPPQRGTVNPAPAPMPQNHVAADAQGLITFLYPATADCHKNFEVVCRATQLLEQQLGQGCFQTVLTINGSENRYARYLKRQWGGVEALRFIGFQKREALNSLYARAHCLVFPSKVETWGLPISEFSITCKPMLLADLPYARETAAGCGAAAFFPPDDAAALSALMLRVCQKDMSAFSPVEPMEATAPRLDSWEQFFAEMIALQ